MSKKKWMIIICVLFLILIGILSYFFYFKHLLLTSKRLACSKIDYILQDDLHPMSGTVILPNNNAGIIPNIGEHQSVIIQVKTGHVALIVQPKNIFKNYIQTTLYGEGVSERKTGANNCIIIGNGFSNVSCRHIGVDRKGNYKITLLNYSLYGNPEFSWEMQ